jgi:hypothetical protein
MSNLTFADLTVDVDINAFVLDRGCTLATTNDANTMQQARSLT